MEGCAGKTWELEKYQKHDSKSGAQANAYQALFKQLVGEGLWAGGFVWKWFPDGEGHEGYPDKDVALLGTVILQFYWINWSVRLNEKQFDDHIITALKRVADKLEKEKENWELSQIEKWIQEGNRPLEDQKRLLEYATLLMSNQISAIMDSSSFSSLDPQYSWDKKREIVEMIDRELRIHPAGLEQRINPQNLPPC
ncbi:MAG: hypothetical protein IPN15_17970 [Saprospiraceae bacterium]|nr:hypothetical protein [Candidatus Vicinibacter affinis]